MPCCWNGMDNKQISIDKINEYLEEKTCYLDLSSLELTELPEAISELIDLEVLDISDNQLTALPDSISSLVNLEWLFINNNQLTELPNKFCKLVNLAVLEVNNNLLTKLPKKINQLNLVLLDVSNNQLTKLPKQFKKFGELEKVYIDDNPLKIKSIKLRKFLKSRLGN